MSKLISKYNKYIQNASIFILGVIATIIITKISDRIFPSDPVFVKEYTDTIKIVHDFKIPAELNSDSNSRELERKIRNLELLNNYDQEIQKRLTNLGHQKELYPNLIITKDMESLARKGYREGNSSSYFSAECPTLTSNYIDIRFNFINPLVIDNISCFRVNIYKFEYTNSSEALITVLEDFYEVKSINNFIRIMNDFENGKYEILFGFILKNEIDSEYPTFYFKKCEIEK
jgi:hypothetical protein